MGKTFEFDAHVLTVGTWKGDPFTSDDLADMAANFTALSAEIKPPVKLGHTPSIKGDGQPAMGWVKALKHVGDDLIATLTDVPEVVYKAIKKGLYKRVSSEVYFKYKGKTTGKTHRRVFSGVALLGADIPAVSTLADLTAFLSQATADVSADSFDKVVVFSSGHVAAEKIIFKDEVKKMEMTEAEVKALKDRAEAAETEAKKFKADDEAKEIELTKLKETEANRVQDGLKAEFKGYCDGLVKEFKLTPAACAILVKEDAHLYSETDGKVVLTLEAFKAYTATLEPIVGLEDGSSEGEKQYGDTGAALDAKVKAYMAEKGVTYTVAMDAMPALEPELYKAYTKDTTDGKTKARKEGE